MTREPFTRRGAIVTLAGAHSFAKKSERLPHSAAEAESLIAGSAAMRAAPASSMANSVVTLACFRGNG